MNLFERDEKENTVDIPDFVEEKDDTDSTSVDMSIFKMSDEELYDDVPKKEVKEEKTSSPRKKSNSTIILCLVLIGILLVTSVVATIYAFKEHKKVAGLETENTQLKAQNTDYQNAINGLNGQIEELNAKLEEKNNAGTSSDPNNKYPAGTVLYITEDGGSQGVREKASKDSDTVTDNSGNPVVLYWGDKITLTADATVDDNGTYWGKTDKGFIRIEVGDEIWASVEPQ